MRALTLSLGEFGVSTVEIEARRYSLSPSEFVTHAARYYLDQQASDRLAHRVPDYLRREPGGEPLEVALDLGDADWRSLLAEAEDQVVSVERLLEHAAMYLVADLDSGRVVGQLLEAEP